MHALGSDACITRTGSTPRPVLTLKARAQSSPQRYGRLVNGHDAALPDLTISRKQFGSLPGLTVPSVVAVHNHKLPEWVIQRSLQGVCRLFFNNLGVILVGRPPLPQSSAVAPKERLWSLVMYYRLLTAGAAVCALAVFAGAASTIFRNSLVSSGDIPSGAVMRR